MAPKKVRKKRKKTEVLVNSKFTMSEIYAFATNDFGSKQLQQMFLWCV